MALNYCLNRSHTEEGSVAWFEAEKKLDACPPHQPPPTPPAAKPRVRLIDGKLVPA